MHFQFGTWETNRLFGSFSFLTKKRDGEARETGFIPSTFTYLESCEKVKSHGPAFHVSIGVDDAHPHNNRFPSSFPKEEKVVKVEYWTIPTV